MNNSKEYYVYILWSSQDQRFYVGYTSYLKRRMKEHMLGKCHTTLRMKTSKLIFLETFYNEGDACRREVYFKTTKGKKALRLMLRESIKTK